MKSLLMNLSLLTGFFPLPFGISVHISLAFSKTCTHAQFSSLSLSLLFLRHHTHKIAMTIESLHSVEEGVKNQPVCLPSKRCCCLSHLARTLRLLRRATRI